ncbi:MAG: MMPL family transporter [Janthinobacterium lividum]
MVLAKVNSGPDATLTATMAATMATAGRTVLFSGVTVALDLTALLVFPVYLLKSFGYVGISVVVFAVAGALIVLPALIAAAAPRLTVHRARRARGQQPQGDGSPRWRSLASAVTARPALLGLPVATALVVVGLPLLHVHFASPDDRATRLRRCPRRAGRVRRHLEDRVRRHTSDTALTVVTSNPEGQPLTANALTACCAALSNQAGVGQVDGPAGSWQTTHPCPPPSRFSRWPP